jgi:hypothetical protein
MKKYKHEYAITFTVESDQKDGEDITSEDMSRAIVNRLIEAAKGEGEDMGVYKYGSYDAHAEPVDKETRETWDWATLWEERDES